MQPATYDYILKVFESLGWVIIRLKDGKPDVIEEHIPLMSDVLLQIGKLELSPEPEIPPISGFSDLEIGTVKALDLCARTPCSLDALSSEVSLEGTTLDLLIQLGDAGRYLDVQSVLDGKVAFSPLYYFNRHEEIQQFFSRQTIASLEPIQNLLLSCSKYVGMPIQKLDPGTQQLALSGIKTGWLIPSSMTFPLPRVSEFTFLYPPLLKFRDSTPSGDIFEKAKVLISSIRFGQSFAPTSRISNPLDVINRIRRDGKLARPHSDAFDQYKVPASKGMFTLKEEDGVSYWGNPYTGWMPYLIDSEENKQILDTTISILTSHSEKATEILELDGKMAGEVLMRDASVYESLEFRGSVTATNIKINPELQRKAYELALSISKGAYE